MTTPTANACLALGDWYRDALPAERKAIAAAIGGPRAQKCAWLAASYDQEDRRVLGPALQSLRSSHLEAVAALEDKHFRNALLAKAHASRMSVRQLRAATLSSTSRQHAAGSAVVTLGAPEHLASAKTALERYSSLDRPGLEMLMAGPNGALILDLARAGQALAVRMGG